MRLLTSLLLTVGLAYDSNYTDLKGLVDRGLGIFALKNLLGAALAALTVWALRPWFKPAGMGNFLFLWIVCGAGSVVYCVRLAIVRAVPISQILAVLESPEES